MTSPSGSTTSTDSPDASVATVPFDPDRAWRLHPKVALRPEPFGALAYHYGNRRLNFLRHPDLVRVVEALERYDSIPATLAGEDIAPARRAGFTKALAALATSNFLEIR